MTDLCYRYRFTGSDRDPDPLRVWRSCQLLGGRLRYNPEQITAWIPQQHRWVFEVTYQQFHRLADEDHIGIP